MTHFISRAGLYLALMLPFVGRSETTIVSFTNLPEQIRRKNPELAAARLRIDEAAGKLRQAGRYTNPQFSTSVAPNTRGREGSIELGLSQKFPLTRRLALEKQVSAAELEAVRAEVENAARLLTSETAEEMVSLLALREKRVILQKQAGLADELSDFLKSTAEKGEGSSLDASAAALDAAKIRQEMRQLDVEETALLIGLRGKLGMSPAEAISINSKLSDTSALHQVSRDKRPDLRVAEWEIKAAAQAHQLAVAKRYDDIEVGVFSSAERRMDAPDGYQNETTLGLRVQIPLPFWDKNEGNIDAAKAQLERKQKELSALGNQVDLEADAARQSMLQWAGIERDLRENLLPQVQTHAEQTEAAFRKGQAELTEVFRARERLLELSLQQNDALREFHRARVSFEFSR
jgi:outer membrane protein, heavy metal efflux system